MDGSEASHEMKTEILPSPKAQGPGVPWWEWHAPLFKGSMLPDLDGQSDPCTGWQRLVSYWDQAALLADTKTLTSVCQ